MFLGRWWLETHSFHLPIGTGRGDVVRPSVCRSRNGGYQHRQLLATWLSFLVCERSSERSRASTVRAVRRHTWTHLDLVAAVQRTCFYLIFFIFCMYLKQIWRLTFVCRLITWRTTLSQEQSTGFWTRSCFGYSGLWCSANQWETRCPSTWSPTLGWSSTHPWTQCPRSSREALFYRWHTGGCVRPCRRGSRHGIFLGCPLLLQLWSHERFDIIRPKADLLSQYDPRDRPMMGSLWCLGG
jgi:hypothetical protein